MAKKVIIIGGGASGLAAAIHAARNDAQVTVLEHGKKPAQKLLATGNGRCNMGNISVHAGHYHSMEPEFVWNILDQYNATENIQFFTSLGIYVKNKDGCLYPHSEQASAVRDVLLMECAYRKIRIKNNTIVTGLEKIPDGWAVHTPGWTYESDAVILATGSPASNIPGADGSGYELAHALGHQIIPPLPALVPLKCTGVDTVRWAGVRIQGRVTLLIDDNPLDSHEGELQLTGYGISGIPVFQISGRAVRALEEGKQVVIRTDLLPDMKAEELQALMRLRKEQCPYKTQREQFIGLLPEKIIAMLPEERPYEWLKALPLKVTGSKSTDYAQVCSGGIALSEVDPDTLESRLHSGLYFAGEILNVDGECGGYNLHWAWATAALAGKHSAEDQNKENP